MAASGSYDLNHISAMLVAFTEAQRLLEQPMMSKMAKNRVISNITKDTVEKAVEKETWQKTPMRRPEAE